MKTYEDLHNQIYVDTGIFEILQEPIHKLTVFTVVRVLK